MSININAANPILTALQDLNTPNPSGADSGGIGGLGASGTTNGSSNAVAIGQNGSLDLSAVDAVGLSLNRATAIGDTAISAGQSVASLLATLKDQATAAEDPSLDGAARQTLNDDFKSVLGQIAATVDQASFDGVNLVDGETTAGLNLPVSADGGGALTLSPQDLSLGGPIVSLGATASLGTSSAAAGALADVTNSLSHIQAALDTLNAQVGQIAAHGAIINRLSGVLAAGANANASNSADGARLLALQVQQQLSSQTQPIANQSPQRVLSLFR